MENNWDYYTWKIFYDIFVEWSWTKVLLLLLTLGTLGLEYLRIKNTRLNAKEANALALEKMKAPGNFLGATEGIDKSVRLTDLTR